MKTAKFALFLCLLLPLAAEAKGKAKAPAKSAGPVEPQAPKGKLIDLTATAGEPTEGLISTEASGRDVEFFMNAYALGGLETWLGEQAKGRGEADRVKRVGDALQSTQAEENDLLQKLARRKGIQLPEKPAPLANQARLAEQLGKASGPAFDKAIMEEISTVTQRAVDVYQRATASKDEEIQKFAQQILPMVQDKLTLAKKLAGKPSLPGGKPGFRENLPPPPPPMPPTP